MNNMDKIETYLNSDDLSHLADSTKSLYETVLDGKLRNFCRINHIDTYIFNSSFQEKMPYFVEFLKNTNVSGKTIQSYVNIVRSFFKAIGEPIIYSYKLTSEEKKKQQEKEINKWFTEEEVQMCLDYEFSSKKKRNKIIVRLLHETGARVNELANVRISDIDFAGRCIKITKSKTRIRYVFFSEETNTLIMNHISTGLFQEDYSLFGISSGRIQKVVKSMLIDLKIDLDGRGCHTFRNWAATYLFYTGNMRIEDVAMLLGDGVEVILSNYLHPTQEMLREKVSKAWGWK